MAHPPFSSALILAGCLHATVKLYRCIHLQEQLAALGVNAEVMDWTDQRFADDTARRYDLLLLQRTVMTANLQQLIDQMRSQGKPVVFDTDDLVFEPAMTDWHRGVVRLPPAEQELYDDGVRRSLAVLEASDALLAASPLLVELAQRRGKPAFLHRNAVGSEMMALGDALYRARRARPAPPGGTVIVGYGSGTPTHDVDFEEALPALLDLLARHPHVELWLAGPLEAPPELTIFGPRVRRFPLMDWRGYLELASRFDIALAPLERANLFCRAKSEIKFVEAGLLGIPTVATRIDPFTHAIEHEADGFLAGHTGEWIAALDALVTQPALRQSVGEAARRKVEQHYSLAARTGELATILAQLRTAVDKRIDTPPTAPEPQPPLVLNWVINEPFAGSGGHLGVFRMIRHLVEFGHECHIYVIPVAHMHDYSPQQLRDFVDQHFLRTGAHFHRWTGRVVEADATFATHWLTAYDVAALPNPGRRYYLVQDFEPYFYPMGTDYLRAEQTYRLGLHCVTLGPWLAGLMRSQYGATADHFDFALDPEIYHPQAQARASHPRVAFYARPSTPRRAYELGIEALHLVKQRCPEAEIILFGAEQLTTPPPFPALNLGVRNQYELAALYASCDVGLVLSLTNPSFVPLEMMACKCAVVDLRSERVQGLLADGVNALLADPTPGAVADRILTLLWDAPLRTALFERAYADVQARSWQTSARQIEQVLLAHAPTPGKRRLVQRTQHGDADSLRWQIEQLLDLQTPAHRETTELEALLRRALAEKAQLTEQLRTHKDPGDKGPTRAARIGGALESARAGWLEQLPAWVQDGQRLSKLVISGAVIEQRFRAERSHLCAVVLRFASHQSPAGGLLQLKLADETQPDVALVDQIIATADIKPGQPHTLAFRPQPHSSGRLYSLRLTPVGGDGRFAHAIWRAWTANPHTVLQRDGAPLKGQLWLHVDYAHPTNTEDVAAPNELQPEHMTTVARRQGVRVVRETQRLAAKTWQALRTVGVGGLAREVSQYLRWQLDKRIRP